jgi:hypothetical protein
MFYGFCNGMHPTTQPANTMRKLTIVVLSCFFVLSSAMAQSSIKGTITDTLNKQNLQNAVISVLRVKDSVLVKFTRTNQQGNFELNNLPAGTFIVMVSYPQYADYVEKFTLEAGGEKSFGKLPLITRANLLQEVIVKQRVAAIRVKGDTTEYRADSFHVGPNADVQELLRKMPGIQVNSKGEITAQGERVQKVLVDGEEFFSDDPAVVTKNLRADAVDKIQAFDKKSDQAAFTGIDDGQKIKTLNIQLKEDKKKGYFGKAEAGSDFDKYRYGKLLANAFKGKRKISGYLTTDNTKYESLNWDENRNYAGDANTTTQVNDDGGISIWSSGDEFSYGRGYPTSTTGGLHFSDKWNKDKHNSNNTYQYNNLNVTGLTSTYTQNLTPGSTLNDSTIQDQVSDRKRHKLTSIYEWQIDSSSSLKLTLRAATVKSLIATIYERRIRNEAGMLINGSTRNTSTEDENNTINSNIFWRKKFKKTGRTISINSDLNFGDRSENTMLGARNDFYEKGIFVSQEITDQKKVKNGVTSTINTLATYTEPVWKNTFLVLNYRLNVSRNDAEMNTYEKNGDGKYETLVDSLSNHFIFNTVSHLGSANIRYNVKKVNFSIGAGVGPSIYRMKDIETSLERKITFNNFVPTINFNYTPKTQRRVTLNYNGSTRNPTLAQIQPLLDNIDPVYVTVGNPFLRQSFIHNFNFRASDFKVLKSRSISFNTNYSFTENAITSSSITDTATGKRLTQAINVDGNYNFNISAGYSFDIITSLNIGLNAGPRKSRYVNRVNGQENITDNSGWSLSMYGGYWSDKWINFWMNFNANYTSSVSSIRPEGATNYWSYNTYSQVQLKFKKPKIYIDLNLEASFYQKTEAFANQQDVYVLSPSIRKVFTKSDAWEVKLYVNDLLNQNRGLQRNVNSNYYSETVYQTIQRYFMFTLAYNFSKNGKPTNNGF